MSRGGRPPRKLRQPPKDSLRILENAAINDYDVARLVLQLFDSILGTTSIFAGGTWRLRDGDLFPKRLRTAGQAVAAWGSHCGIILNELIRVRQEIIAAIVRMRRASPFGRRRIRIANDLRAAHPARKPERSANVARLQDLPILGDDVGRPLGHGLIRRLSAFSPSRIEIRGASDSWYAAATSDAAYVTLAADGYTVERITLAKVVAPGRVGDRVEGLLEEYFETGSEGVIWAVIDPEERGYESLHFIEEGDRLKILNELGHLIWSGTIRCDRKAGWRRYPSNPEYGQPCALGCWIHWTQKGFKPDDWARFFINRGKNPLRAILRKKPKLESRQP
jgi:hypothetical protein